MDVLKWLLKLQAGDRTCVSVKWFIETRRDRLHIPYSRHRGFYTTVTTPQAH